MPEEKIENRFRHGDVVEFLPGESPRWAGYRFRVHRMLQVNVELEVPGSARKLRARPSMLHRCEPGVEPSGPAGRPATPTGTMTTDPVTGAMVTTFDFPEHFDVGQFVAPVPGTTWKVPRDAVFVVIRDNVDSLKLVLAGGQDGKYWPRIPKHYVRRATVDLRVI